MGHSYLTSTRSRLWAWSWLTTSSRFLFKNLLIWNGKSKEKYPNVIHFSKWKWSNQMKVNHAVLHTVEIKADQQRSLWRFNPLPLHFGLKERENTFLTFFFCICIIFKCKMWFKIVISNYYIFVDHNFTNTRCTLCCQIFF